MPRHRLLVFVCLNCFLLLVSLELIEGKDQGELGLSRLAPQLPEGFPKRRIAVGLGAGDQVAGPGEPVGDRVEPSEAVQLADSLSCLRDAGCSHGLLFWRMHVSVALPLYHPPPRTHTSGAKKKAYPKTQPGAVCVAVKWFWGGVEAGCCALLPRAGSEIGCEAVGGAQPQSAEGSGPLFRLAGCTAQPTAGL